MQIASPQPPSSSARRLNEAPRVPSKLIQDEAIARIVPNKNLVFKVLIVDRDSMTSDLLVLALCSDRRYEAASVHASNLVRAVARSEVHLVIIGSELNSEGSNGLRLAESLHRAQPDLRIIMLIDDTSSESVINAFRSGARGVFCRRQSVSEFLDCVEHVRKGFIWAGQEETSHLLEALKSVPKVHSVSDIDLPMLTARELEVVRYAARGMTNKTIAREMGLSEHTVKNYLFRVFSKIGVSSRVELLFHLASRTNSLDVTVGLDEPDGVGGH